MRIKVFIGIILTAISALSITSVQATELATAMAVDQTAFVREGRTARVIISGNRLSQGDVIETQRTGQVQLIFDDKTRIVVGPNSRLIVDQILMKSERSASRFAITAVKGSFRFITGTSSKAAYEIRTPTATMGVRGTIFDFAVNTKRETDLAVLYGSVNFCGRSGECKRVNRGCNLAYTDPRGKVDTPKTRKEGAERIITGFPYLFTQKTLMSGFRTRTDSCARYTRAARTIAAAAGTTPQGANGISAPAATPSTPTTPGTPSTGGTPSTSGNSCGGNCGNGNGGGGGNGTGNEGNGNGGR